MISKGQRELIAFYLPLFILNHFGYIAEKTLVYMWFAFAVLLILEKVEGDGR